MSKRRTRRARSTTHARQPRGRVLPTESLVGAASAAAERSDSAEKPLDQSAQPSAPKVELNIEDRAKQNPIIGALLLVGLILAALVVIWTFGSRVNGFLNWRSVEETKMEKISIGMPISSVEEMFGKPNKKRSVTESAWGTRGNLDPQEHVLFWKERGYWVLIHEVDDRVEAYELRMCDSRLHPSVSTIVANKTRLSEPNGWPPSEARYTAAPSWYEYVEGTTMSRALNGKRVSWGVAVAPSKECRTPYALNTDEDVNDVDQRWHIINGSTGPRGAGFVVSLRDAESNDPALIEETRRSLVVNMIGEQAHAGEFAPSGPLSIHPDELVQIN